MPQAGERALCLCRKGLSAERAESVLRQGNGGEFGGSMQIAPQGRVCKFWQKVWGACRSMALHVDATSEAASWLSSSRAACCACLACRSMALHVDATNEAARQLYLREGYRDAMQQSQCERLLEGRPTPLILMMKPLSSARRSTGA